MAGLPKLPGLSFGDPTVSRFHLSHSFDISNGYKLSKPLHLVAGIGSGDPVCNSVAFIDKYDPVRFDPSLIYGRTRSTPQEQFLPHYAQYDQKCLTFKAFFKQSVFESPDEYYRVRQVNVIYFLEDDTMTVMEPKINNSGLCQGRLVRRGKIIKSKEGTCWHWKDLQVGKDIAINGIVYHLVDADLFTREYMLSQGIEVRDTEEMPVDPYTQNRLLKEAIVANAMPKGDSGAVDDKLRRFLEYDGKVLKFNALWDDRDSEYGDIRKCIILYFLADDTVAVKEVHELNSGRDPFPLLLRKTKLPKIYSDRPVNYPSIYFELTDSEVSEFYQPKDFVVGETVFILGRKMLLYDCDDFTRNYFRKVLCMEQKVRMDVDAAQRKKEMASPPLPPHDGFGSLEDSLQNTLTVLPKPPRKDVFKQLLNANKYLRYEMKFDVVHPEDEIREFIMMYSLADGTVKIHEKIIKNSGIMGGKYLRSTMLIKPGSDPLNPDYYTPADFYIGAVVNVFEQRFIITNADLYVYRYMQANSDKFPCEIIENLRNHLFNRDLLSDDLKDQIDDNQEIQKKKQRDALVKELDYPKDNLELCYEAMNIAQNIGVGETHAQEQVKESPQRKEYDYGLAPVNLSCQYPVQIGDVRSTECKGVGPKALPPPPKPNVVCFGRAPIVCEKPDMDNNLCKSLKEQAEQPKPIMVHKTALPPNACLVKQVRFAPTDPCERDRYDLCNFKHEDKPCDCTHYEQK